MLKANQHFILSFFGPPLFAALACYGVYLLQFWMEWQNSVLLTIMLITSVVMLLAARWAIRSFITVRCPYCKGRAYEIQGRGGRFMCMVCGRDH
ncbi:MAG: hypothetical protein JNG86_00760 [Verrucomicrobiaceae bacterium]|nr:hypothetical protein [Verrucomicrobiaceae bacterium]